MKKLFVVVFILVSFIGNQSFSQSKNSEGHLLFDSDKLLELELYFNIPAILNDREKEHKFDAKIIYYDNDSTPHELKTQIRVRGNFRRKQANCAFPPYSLYFDKANTANTIFEGQKKIKFVSHCNGGDMVLEEYLLYRTYAILTNNAYKVRLANVNYVDYSGDIMTFNAYAFLLENTKKMGKRLDGKIIKPDSIYFEELNSRSVAMISLFHYLIGNTDWDFSMQKNFKYLERNDSHIIPIAYDFDLAEVINTYYPTHESIFGKEATERRTFKCLEIEKDVFFDAVNTMKSKKGEIYDLYLEFPYLSNTRKIEILNYYEEFFDQLKRKRKLYRELKKVCKNRS